ncbi:hypothetical protein GOBAR_AA36456 [Gossypium barbadense]|uniref:Isopenicillin N synthase-like Fe(2+) 2OG dioxygenase domain-containing protein n=1 Tax=Gossypium barbadense TaxID=3634 RepID=A0A2P5VZK1_GOSBA|nr:hypothetical protein GOBAR_AA36456 [Gossypium barbadense]
MSTAGAGNGVASTFGPWSFDPLNPKPNRGTSSTTQGKWVNIDPIPNSFLANIGDHIEGELNLVEFEAKHTQILSNGKYKSVLHRAVVNNRDVRISIAVPHGPALDAIVSPAPKLVEIVGNPPAYGAMKYKEYLELQQGSMLNGKSSLERIRNGV